MEKMNTITSTIINNELPNVNIETNDSSNNNIKKDKCNKCNKKLGLIPFNCKCGKFFCSSHRYSFSHDCTFNDRENNQKILEKTLIKVTSDKVIKI